MASAVLFARLTTELINEILYNEWSFCALCKITESVISVAATIR